jgi:thymidine phosphorylase
VKNTNTSTANQLTLKWLGIDTYKETVLYLHRQCPIARSEGFEIHARVRVSSVNGNSILATLNYIDNELLTPHEASLSKYAWELLAARPGDTITLTHPQPLHSLSFVRSKIFGHELSDSEIAHIIEDVAKGYYSDIHIASFLTACAGGRLNDREIIALTHSMIDVGQRLTWPAERVVDKHCVGGLPANRTTLIIVPIVTAFGMTMPKTSSRAITSPAGTADTMETLAPVELDLPTLRHVVEQEHGCIVWGGAVSLSPADDILLRVERVMNLDSEGQLIASVISKKVSTGSNHILIDIPVGPTTKIRTLETAKKLQCLFTSVANALDLQLKIVISDGMQPIGRGIGPALEARDVLAVLQNLPNAPQDLRERSLLLAGEILEFSPAVKAGEGLALATQILDEGRAWQKFQAICEAQGGMRTPPVASHTHTVSSTYCGCVRSIDNRQLARLAKLAGAPHDKAAGITLHAHLETSVEKGQPLFTIHAESKGELRYAMSLLEQIPEVIQIEVQE